MAGIKDLSRAQIGNADIDLAADRGVVDIVAKLLGDAERAVNFAEAGVAFQRAVDAAVFGNGVRRASAESPKGCLFFGSLLGRMMSPPWTVDVEEAARV